MFPIQDGQSGGFRPLPYSDQLPPYISDEDESEEEINEKEAMSEKQTAISEPSSTSDNVGQHHLETADHVHCRDSLDTVSSTDDIELCLEYADESRKLTEPSEFSDEGRLAKYGKSAKRAGGAFGGVVARMLLPSFLKRKDEPPKRLHPSAWLDGLRGVAAFCVVFHHASLVVFSWDIHKGWNPGSEDSWIMQFIQLPIIRLLIGGPQQVALFFVVSGYAISYKAIKLSRQSDFKGVGLTLFSSVFRRHTRLFMPAAIVTLCCALMVQIDRGWYSGIGIPGTAVPTRVPPIAGGLWEQVVHWSAVEVGFTSPLNNGLAQDSNPHIVGNPYDPNLWTLPVEFSSSLVVFSFLTAFALIHNRIRMFAAVALAIYLEWYFAFWTIFLFFGGMVICDLHFEIEEIKAKLNKRSTELGETNVLPMWARVAPQDFFENMSDRFSRLQGSKRVLGRLIGVVAFVFSLHVLGVPAIGLGGRTTFGYVTLMSWVPDKLGDNFLTPLGAIMTVFTLDHAVFLQILFTNRFSQFLGRISFSLYMIHGPLLWSVGLKLALYFIAVLGATTEATYGLAIFFTTIIWWIIAIYLADLTTTFVDEPCVKFSRWAYSKISKSDSN